MREELSFFSNQCLDEVKRVSQDNGKLLTDHFLQLSQVQCQSINEVSCCRIIEYSSTYYGQIFTHTLLTTWAMSMKKLKYKNKFSLNRQMQWKGQTNYYNDKLIQLVISLSIPSIYYLLKIAFFDVISFNHLSHT